MASQTLASTLAAAPVARLGARRSRPTRARVLTIRAASATEKDDKALESESAGAAKRDEESKAAGVQNERRAPRGGEAPPPGKWEWTLNWDPIVYDKTAREPLYAPSEDELAAADTQ